MAAMSGLNSLTHYLDDFLFAGKVSTVTCTNLFGQFMDLTDKSGVPLDQEKMEGPSRLDFLGIELDSVQASSRLPQDKLSNHRGLIRTLLGRSKVTLKELQMLLWHLNLTCRVVIFGHAFCNCLYAATSGVWRPHHFIRVTREIKEDRRM